MLAEPKRKLPFSQLLHYDKPFCSHAAKNYADLKIWLTRNEEAYIEFLDPTAYQASGSAETVISENSAANLKHANGATKLVTKKSFALNLLSVLRFFGPAPREVGQINSRQKHVLSGIQGFVRGMPEHHANTVVCINACIGQNPILAIRCTKK